MVFHVQYFVEAERLALWKVHWKLQENKNVWFRGSTSHWPINNCGGASGEQKTLSEWTAAPVRSWRWCNGHRVWAEGSRLQREHDYLLRRTRSHSSQSCKRKRRNHRVHTEHTTLWVSDTHTHTLPFESDAERSAVGFWERENDQRIDSDEHLKGEDKLHLPETPGYSQRHGPRRCGDFRVAVQVLRYCKIHTSGN